MHLNLDSSILFNSGSADLSDAVKQMLDKLVPDLKQVSSNPVIVAGYTDNVRFQNEASTHQTGN